VTALVVGGGFAGIAAAWALSERGRDVHLVWAHEGASALYPGVLDRTEWTGPPDPRPLSSEVVGFLEGLGLFAAPGSVAARVATTAGMLRPARCRDRALFDLESVRGKRVSVVDLGRPGWDAGALARAWSASAWARLTRTEFKPLTVAAPAPDQLRWLGEADLAARGDDPVWTEALGGALRDAGDGDTPLIVGPWLGSVPGSAERWREIVRRPLGETLSPPGGAAGLRFEAARSAWLARASVSVLRGEAHALRRVSAGFEVSGRFGPGGERDKLDDVYSDVVLAIGGMIGGGIRFLSGSGSRPLTFSLSIDVPVELRLAGREVAIRSELGGADLQRLGLSALDEIGVLVDEQQRAVVAGFRAGDPTMRAPDLFAAGDVVAERPRTVLEAIHAGIGAARGVCRMRASTSP
jgi:glycerol-3-phosphate dehydrogenase subunit B